MKRYFILTILALGALGSSCEMVEQPEQIAPQPSGTAGSLYASEESDDSVLFTATIGDADTKTYMEWSSSDYGYKLNWDSDDHIHVFNRNGASLDEGDYEYCSIADGAGTPTATFGGTLQAESYFAYYGTGGYYINGVLYPSIPTTQSHHYESGPDDIDIYYPMAAVSTDGSFKFKNLFGVLQLEVCGNGEVLEYVRVYSNDGSTQMSGYMQLDLDGRRPKLIQPESFPVEDMHVYNDVYYLCYYYLDPTDPIICNIALPAQTYPGGFTVELRTDRGWMELSTSENVVLDPSEIRRVPQISYVSEVIYHDSWALIGEMNSWREDLSMEYYEDLDVYVLSEQYLEAGQEFKFRANASWEVNLGTGDGAEVSPDTDVALFQDGANITVSESGYYNIYLDVTNGRAHFELYGSGPSWL